jgi:hypothetical protein
VTISYGDWPADAFVLAFGFLPPPSRHDSAVLFADLRALVAAHDLLQARRASSSARRRAAARGGAALRALGARARTLVPCPEGVIPGQGPDICTQRRRGCPVCARYRMRACRGATARGRMERCDARPAQEGGGSEGGGSGEPGSARSGWPPAQERAQALEDALGPGDWRRRASPQLAHRCSCPVPLCRCAEEGCSQRVTVLSQEGRGGAAARRLAVCEKAVAHTPAVLDGLRLKTARAGAGRPAPGLAAWTLPRGDRRWARSAGGAAAGCWCWAAASRCARWRRRAACSRCTSTCRRARARWP